MNEFSKYDIVMLPTGIEVIKDDVKCSAIFPDYEDNATTIGHEDV